MAGNSAEGVGMLFDVWFARDHRGHLWFNVTKPGEGPETKPTKVESVHEALQQVRKSRCKIAQVGICDLDMLRI